MKLALVPGICLVLLMSGCDSVVPGIGGAGQPCSTKGTCKTGLACFEGKCLPLKGQGSDCASSILCATGYCVDGYCCNKACDGICEACDGISTFPGAGTCGYIIEGEDPAEECPEQDPFTCGTTGYCDGIGACKMYGEETVCDDGVFCNGQDCCDGAGNCLLHTGDPCGFLNCYEDSCIEYWEGLGGSDFGPWSSYIVQGSSSCCGGISNNRGGSYSPSVALDGSGNPVVAWADNTSEYGKIYVKRYSGSEWVDVGTKSSADGGISNNSTGAWYPCLALDSSGNPVVAWSDYLSGNYEIYVKRFDGSFWVDVGSESSTNGGISDNSGNSYSPALFLDSSGNPVVAWYDDTSGNWEIYIRRFNGTAWVDVGDNSSTGGGISKNVGESLQPSLALDSSGNPVVAWNDNTSGNYEIYVKRFDGTAWVDAGVESSNGGGISKNAGYSDVSSLTLDVFGNPVVAWDDNTSGSWEIYIRRFDGIDWVDVGDNSSSGGGISNTGGAGWPSLGLAPSGQPVVAWVGHPFENAEIYVKHFDGSDWVDVGVGSSSGGGISNNSGYSASPCLSLGDTGNLVVAWNDNTSGNAEIYCKKFDGSAWVDVGTGTSSVGGISNNEESSLAPSIAMDDSGIPIVAWENYNSSANSEIYVKQFDGINWVDVGVGSSSGGGISNTSGISIQASLALDGLGCPFVAWCEYMSENSEIYVKKFDGIHWVDVGVGSSSGGGISDNSGYSVYPSLSLDDSGNPAVAWFDATSGNWEIYLKRFNGSDWVDVGDNSSSGGGISNNSGYSVYPSLSLDDSGNPEVAWSDATSGNWEIYIKRFDGTAWVDVGGNSSSGGGISNSVGESLQPSLALDGSGNPVVACNDNTSGNYEIYVKRFNGSDWVDVGDNLSSGGGISNNSGYSVYPSLSLDDAGNPIVAWEDETSGNGEIYVRRFNGTDWVDVGVGSSSGGGVSNSYAVSFSHSLAVFPGGRACVAWTECGEILLRCSGLQ